MTSDHGKRAQDEEPETTPPPNAERPGACAAALGGRVESLRETEQAKGCEMRLTNPSCRTSRCLP